MSKKTLQESEFLKKSTNQAFVEKICKTLDRKSVEYDRIMANRERRKSGMSLKTSIRPETQTESEFVSNYEGSVNSLFRIWIDYGDALTAQAGSQTVAIPARAKIALWNKKMNQDKFVPDTRNWKALCKELVAGYDTFGTLPKDVFDTLILPYLKYNAQEKDDVSAINQGFRDLYKESHIPREAVVNMTINLMILFDLLGHNATTFYYKDVQLFVVIFPIKESEQITDDIQVHLVKENFEKAGLQRAYINLIEEMKHLDSKHNVIKALINPDELDETVLAKRPKEIVIMERPSENMVDFEYSKSMSFALYNMDVAISFYRYLLRVLFEYISFGDINAGLLSPRNLITKRGEYISVILEVLFSVSGKGNISYNIPPEAFTPVLYECDQGNYRYKYYQRPVLGTCISLRRIHEYLVTNGLIEKAKRDSKLYFSRRYDTNGATNFAWATILLPYRYIWCKRLIPKGDRRKDVVYMTALLSKTTVSFSIASVDVFRFIRNYASFSSSAFLDARIFFRFYWGLDTIPDILTLVKAARTLDFYSNDDYKTLAEDTQARSELDSIYIKNNTSETYSRLESQLKFVVGLFINLAVIGNISSKFSVHFICNGVRMFDIRIPIGAPDVVTLDGDQFDHEVNYMLELYTELVKEIRKKWADYIVPRRDKWGPAMRLNMADAIITYSDLIAKLADKTLQQRFDFGIFLSFTLVDKKKKYRNHLIDSLMNIPHNSGEFYIPSRAFSTGILRVNDYSDVVGHEDQTYFGTYVTYESLMRETGCLNGIEFPIDRFPMKEYIQKVAEIMEITTEFDRKDVRPYFGDMVANLGYKRSILAEESRLKLIDNHLLYNDFVDGNLWLDGSDQLDVLRKIERVEEVRVGTVI